MLNKSSTHLGIIYWYIFLILNFYCKELWYWEDLPVHRYSAILKSKWSRIGSLQLFWWHSQVQQSSNSDGYTNQLVQGAAPELVQLYLRLGNPLIFYSLLHPFIALLLRSWPNDGFDGSPLKGFSRSHAYCHVIRSHVLKHRLVQQINKALEKSLASGPLLLLISDRLTRYSYKSMNTYNLKSVSWRVKKEHLSFEALNLIKGCIDHVNSITCHSIST